MTGSIEIQEFCDTTFTENIATNAGGAISFEGGSLFSNQQSHVLFTRNIASIGGAICLRNAGGIKNECLTQSCFTYENNAALLGGAVYISSEHELTQSIKVNSTQPCPS